MNVNNCSLKILALEVENRGEATMLSRELWKTEGAPNSPSESQAATGAGCVHVSAIFFEGLLVLLAKFSEGGRKRNPM